MSKSKPTIEEQLKALAALREFAGDASCNSLNPVSRAAAFAVNVLDNADLFADLDTEAFDREASKTPRTPVAIEQNGPLWQARGVDGHIWSTATTYKKVEEHLAEQSTVFLIVLPADLELLKADT